MGYISHYLSKLFAKLGRIVGTYPKTSVVIPVVLTLFLSYGVTYYKYIEDVQYLYTITGSENKLARKFVANYFPEKPNYFDPSRSIDIGRFVRIVVTDKEENNVLRTEFWKELLELDEFVTSVEVNNKNFTELCVTWKDSCFPLNQFLEMEQIMPEIENGSLRLSHPVMFNLKTLNAYPLDVFLGGMNISETHTVLSAKAIVLNYIVKVENEEDDLVGREWEAKVMNHLEELDSRWKYLKVYRLSFFTFANEGWVTLMLAMPAFGVTGALAGLFAVVTFMQTDCVRSKPAMGFVGMVSALLATAASFGVLCFFEFPLMLLDCAVPFILIGIGLDDAFVLIASWRQTNCRDSVPKRLSDCYSEAAVSITITSLTDMLSFYVGILTPIPCVQLFCLYAGTGVIFIYLWHLLFFGGILALLGNLEEQNKHSIFWWKQAIPKSKSDNLSAWKKLTMTGGYDDSDPKNPVNESENPLMTFFRDEFSTVICSKVGKTMVVITFIAYIILSCYGISQLEEGIELEKLVRYDSDMAKFIEKHKEHFSEYGFRVQIVIGTPLDYSTNETQSRVNEMLKEIYGLPSLTEEYNENWLRDYTRYLEVYQDLFELNVTNEKEFNQVYLEQYSHDGQRTRLDVKFSEDNSTILATRYIIQSKHIGTPNAVKDLLLDLRGTLKKYKDLNATAFMPWFDFADQAIIIRELTIKLVIVAALVVMMITVLFIPSFYTSLAVFFSIAFIELGVLGFMSFWGVHLDLISVISILACIGFAVDFSAHISYAYISSNAPTSEERIRNAMNLLGLPIAQGAISTIIGVLGLLYIPSYTFHVNFKVILLVMTFATFHGLFVLPVAFNIIKPENIQSYFRSKTYSVKKGKMLRF